VTTLRENLEKLAHPELEIPRSYPAKICNKNA
jgi:hypothetical protein